MCLNVGLTYNGKWTAFIGRFYPTRFTILPDIHTPPAMQGDSQLVGAGLITAVFTHCNDRSVLRRVLLNRPIRALATASPQRKVIVFRRRASGRCAGRKKGLRGREGAVTPLRCVNVGPSQPFSVRCLAQGHLETQLGGAGYRTNNLAVTDPLYLFSVCRQLT